MRRTRKLDTRRSTRRWLLCRTPGVAKRWYLGEGDVNHNSVTVNFIFEGHSQWWNDWRGCKSLDAQNDFLSSFYILHFGSWAYILATQFCLSRRGVCVVSPQDVCGKGDGRDWTQDVCMYAIQYLPVAYVLTEFWYFLSYISIFCYSPEVCVAIVSRVVTPNDTLAGTALWSNQKDTHDTMTNIQQGM